MSKLYLKLMTSFDADIQEVMKNPEKAIRKALSNGVELDGEVYFPMTDYNEDLYEIKNDGFELNVDGAFDGEIIKFVE